ncbi:MAG: hypothetical protein OXC05_05140 [Halieaceae bacterium]|nr:hypothetical protein [Halieaceae bacterium]
MATITGAAFIRGEIYSDSLVTFGGRGGDASFLAPDPMSLLDHLPLRDPGALRDLYELKFDDIVDYLVELGEGLDLSKNEFVQEALEHSYLMTDMTPPLLHRQYSEFRHIFRREFVRQMADVPIGIPLLEDWQEVQLSDGRLASIRAMGARSLHIVAGNSPFVTAITIVRNAITRSDAIIKLPSNDPLTALAIARTMADFAPDHPLTKHLSVAYWKGGTEEFEQRLYLPSNLEKIVAWGGFASLKHVTRYIHPGLELISLDPKRSATVIGQEAFASEASMREVARRAASDMGSLNQLGCTAARVIYVACGTGIEGVVKLNHLGEMIYEALLGLPGSISSKPKRFDPELRDNIRVLKSFEDYYTVIGGEEDEGAVIVSHAGEPVDFHTSLAGRVANLVPIDKPLDALRGMSAYTQTIGIYPEALKSELRDILPLYGAQRMVSLGYANTGNSSLPQDAIEPTRRMCKWIVDESCDPARIPAPWLEN